ncbi:hypothetical protein [Desertimonas flava]|jgi:hypothetical protein|uniref:hypothetical protein n=1 Tax=Desertimonas flava TaxID=2064846 RepID=UPI000E351DFC|nr:hypothetical protein [Desertimonas flava]
MSQFTITRHYLEARASRLLRRVREDDRGAATAEQIILIGAAVVGAAAVGVIIWNKMQDGANAIPTPSP